MRHSLFYLSSRLCQLAKPAPFTRVLFLSTIALLSGVMFSGISLLLPGSAMAQSAPTNSAAIKWSGEGLKLELQALSLDLTRAFFLGRGFNAKSADHIAQTGCIFRAALGNSGLTASSPAVSIRLANWRTIRPDGRHPVRTREDWAKIWEARNISETAKTAFHWALFPTTQSYQSTDYNWGMISFALPPGSRFDLEVHWLQGGEKKMKLLKNLECGK